MVDERRSFLRRAQKILELLRAGRYPNSTNITEYCNCSRSTAQRTIYRLRDEHLVPIEYDEAKRGYFLRDRDYTLPVELPPGKDELAALLLARILLETLELPELTTPLDSLWEQYAIINHSVRRDLKPLAAYFTSDITSVGDLVDCGLLDLVQYAQDGTPLSLQYKSPWRHLEPVTYTGLIEHVHFSDGSLYCLFSDSTAKKRILNASFIRDLAPITDRHLAPFASVPLGETERRDADGWRKGFGVWSDVELQTIRIRVAPPAAEYYAAQRWHADQEDRWDDGVLVREMPGMVSPEIVRRVLSLGRYVVGVEPEGLAVAVREEVREMAGRWGE